MIHICMTNGDVADIEFDGELTGASAIRRWMAQLIIHTWGGQQFIALEDIDGDVVVINIAQIASIQTGERGGE